jgi:hypothetical protein
MSREGEIVLIHIKDQPTIYARIEAIEPDVKKGWYRITLLLLSIPQQVITWILKEEYINGAAFTMDGNPVMLQEVKRMPVPAAEKETSKKAGVETVASGKGKVLPFKTNLK